MVKQERKYQVVFDKGDPWSNNETNEYPNIGFIRINGGPRKIC